jgi:hypothetical protein
MMELLWLIECVLVVNHPAQVLDEVVRVSYVKQYELQDPQIVHLGIIIQPFVIELPMILVVYHAIMVPHFLFHVNMVILIQPYGFVILNFSI